MANSRKAGKRKVGMWIDSEYADALLQTAHQGGSSLSTILERLSHEWLCERHLHRFRYFEAQLDFSKIPQNKES